MTVTIRPATPDDYAQWRPLWDGYNRFYGRFDATALPEEVTAQTWSRFFDEAEPLYALVAEEDGKIAGIVHYHFYRSTTLLGDDCYLQDLFTVPARRGKGVGRKLIEAVYDVARAKGLVRVFWHTHETNARAQVLYNDVAERSGFIVYRKMF
ncbi:MAG TPA: GNAT family N-acetyltransferase [Rhizomicrobium sp.]|jgi:GNAT superfamily N-acetyltransferase|nr:GNAT family N-acetyltransferase [Rhizomicrobium sp.]